MISFLLFSLKYIDHIYNKPPDAAMAENSRRRIKNLLICFFSDYVLEMF